MNGGAAWLAAAMVSCAILAVPASGAAQQAPDAPSGKSEPDLAKVVKAQQKQIEEQQQRIDGQQQRMDGQQRQIDELRKELEAKNETPAAGTTGGTSKDDAQLRAILSEAQSGGSGASGGTAAEASQVQAFEPSFKLYGFADMGLQKIFGTGPIVGLEPTNATTFALGNVNIYFDAQPSPSWRFLTEVRFSLLPDGALDYSTVSAGNIAITDTTVSDTSSPVGLNQVKWGGIVLERAHIDYTPRDWLNVRVGYFLTPFGIWNVDHGTPTLIPTMYPIFMLSQMFPLHQLGIEASGRVNRGPWEYGYHLYVSNGRTPTQIDLTDNKYVGGRFVVRTTQPFAMQFGLSGMFGWYDQATKAISITPSGGFGFTNKLQVQYAEQILGADVSLDIGGFRLRSEGVLRRVVYRHEHRDVNSGLPASNRFEADGYLLLAYRLPWGGLEPFVEFEVDKSSLGFAEGSMTPSVGLNIHFTPAVVLKTQYSYQVYTNFFQHTDTPTSGHVNYVLARLAIAF